MGRRDNWKRQQRKEVERTHSSLDVRSDGKRHGLQFRSGPLPQPEDFDRYNVVLPGAAERLLTMAEKEQAHRHKLEELDTAHDHRQERAGLRWGGTLTIAGMVAALIALLGVLGAGVWLILEGHPLGGYTALVTATVAVIGVFVGASQVQKRQKGARPPRENDNKQVEQQGR